MIIPTRILTNKDFVCLLIVANILYFGFYRAGVLTRNNVPIVNIQLLFGSVLLASESDVAKVETFAEKIGLAFQVADDILDCTASSEELGKTAGKDEMVDKATYVRLLGLEGAKAEAQKLTDEAKECLSEWGEEADGLRAIADFIISRSN